jgi:hypothetical protein
MHVCMCVCVCVCVCLCVCVCVSSRCLHLLRLQLQLHYYLTEYLEGIHLVRARSETKRQLPHVEFLPRLEIVVHEESPYVSV